MAEDDSRKTDAAAGQETQEQSFEETLARLEDAVNRLESGALGLDDSLKLYEQGIAAYRECQEQLARAELKISKLVESLEGELKEEPFEPPNE